MQDSPAVSKNGLTMFDGVELKLFDRKLLPDTIFTFLGRLDKWPRNDIKVRRQLRENNRRFDKLVWPPPEGSEVAAMLTPEAMREWDYDIFRFNEITEEHPLFWMAMAILHQYDLPAKLNVTSERLGRFVAMVEAGYNECIYHNSLHAADVTHALHCLLQCGDTWKKFSPEELFSCIMAAGIHDMGHPGVTNMYLVKQKHPTAIKHENNGVLEKHSWSMASTLLELPEYDPTVNMPPQRRQEVRDLIREQVLRTDMTLHYQLTKEVIALATQGNPPPESCETLPLDLADEKQRRVALQLLVHSADLSNLCKRWDVHIQWSHAILAEFFSQGDLEKFQDIPVSEFGVRNISLGRTNQKNFIANIVTPLYKLCREALPSVRGVCDASIQQMDRNYARWAALNY